MPAILIAVIILALVYAFLNGANDSSSIVATMISSRALSQRTAMGLTALAEFCGPFVFGIAVAKTITRVVVNPQDLNTTVILAAIIGALAWIILTAYLGLPCSSSHALIGGLIGAVTISVGMQAIRLTQLGKILLFLFISPLIGFGIGFIILHLIMELSRNASPNINRMFRRSQLLTVIALGLSHSSNDAPKTMGIITLALMTEKYIQAFYVPFWVILLSAAAIAAGTAVGRQKLIRTIGARIYKISPVDAFSAQLSSAMIVVAASLLGGPVSATQVISSAIMGGGAATNPGKVRWKIAQDIGAAWVLTIPLSAFIAAVSYKLLTRSLL